MLEVSLTPTAATTEAARRSRELFERFGDRWGAAFSKLLLAFAELQRTGPSEAGARLVEEADATFTELGDPWGEAFAGRARLLLRDLPPGAVGGGRGGGAAGPGPVPGPRRPVGGGPDPVQPGRDREGPGRPGRGRGRLRGRPGRRRATEGRCGSLLASLGGLGGLLALRGDDARSAALHAEAVALFRRTGQRRGFAHLYNELGGVARIRGDLERARQLHAGGPGHRPGPGRLERPPHPGPAGLRRGPPGRPRRRRGPPGRRRPACSWPSPSPRPPPTPWSARPWSRSAAAGPSRPRACWPPPRRSASAAGFAAVGAERHEAELAAGAVRGRPRPGRPGRRPAAGRALATDDGPAGTGCQRLNQGRP